MVDEGTRQSDLTEFVSFACNLDINRLLILLMSMNSTVRHFKIAIKLFTEVLKQQKLKGLLALDKKFVIPQLTDELNQK